MGNLFIPMQDSAKRAYDELIQFFALEDYHAQYIRTFQIILSSMLKEDFLVNDPDYKEAVKLYPLPTSDKVNQYLPQEGFRYYIMVFEKIMRKNNIIGGFDPESPSEATDGSTLDPLMDYRKRFRNGFAK